MAYCASGAELQALVQYIKESTFLVITGHILSVKGFAVDSIEDMKAESNQDDEMFRDTSVAKSWEPQNGQHAYFTRESLYDAYTRTVAADPRYEAGHPMARG